MIQNTLPISGVGDNTNSTALGYFFQIVELKRVELVLVGGLELHCKKPMSHAPEKIRRADNRRLLNLDPPAIRQSVQVRPDFRLEPCLRLLRHLYPSGGDQGRV